MSQKPTENNFKINMVDKSWRMQIEYWFFSLLLTRAVLIECKGQKITERVCGRFARKSCRCFHSIVPICTVCVYQAMVKTWTVLAIEHIL